MEDLDENGLREKISEIVSKFDTINESDNYVNIVFEMVIKLKQMNLERTENDLIVACIELASDHPKSGDSNSHFPSFLEKRKLRELGDLRETKRISLHYQIRDLLNLPERNFYPNIPFEYDVVEQVSRGAKELFRTASDVKQLQEFVKKYAKQIAEVKESEFGYINPIAILSLNEKYSVLESLEMTWFPHRGAPREYLRKTGPSLDGTPSEEVFNDEEYRRLLLEDEEFKLALSKNIQAYELLKNKIEEFENSN